jgi:hypothetical protein
LLEYLLKLGCWKAELQYNDGHWKAKILNFCQQINDCLKNSPSLKPYLIEIFEECYRDAREIISDRSKLPLTIFPIDPIATPEKVLDENWLPVSLDETNL